MTYEKIDFNHEHIAGLTLADFTEQNKANFFLNQPEGVRIDKLKEVWVCCRASMGLTGEEIGSQVITPAPAPKVETGKKKITEKPE